MGIGDWGLGIGVKYNMKYILLYFLKLKEIKMSNKYHNENKLYLNNLDLNKTFYHQKKKTNINNYEISADKNIPKGMQKVAQNNPIKLTSLIKEEKTFPKSLSKKIYIISKNKDNQISLKNTKYKKAKSSLNNNYYETDFNNREYDDNKKNINDNNINNIINDKRKFIDKSKEENINNKTNSKDKTYCYSVNNTFNNTNSNTYINNTANNNINILEKDNINQNPINIIDERFNLTSNSDNLKTPNINIISASNLKNINHFKNNNLIINDNNVDNYSYGNKTLYEYYLPKAKLVENKKRRENLITESRKFYLYCSERGILNKLRQLQSKNIEKELKENGLDFYNKKLNLYSDIRRLPTKVSFRKGNSSSKDEMKDLEIYYKYNNDKFIKNLINKKYKGEAEKKFDNYHKIITNGFPKPKNKNKNKFDYILENKLVINSKKEKSFKKNKLIIDQDLYPLLNQKKILKNILPKEADYNTQFTINDIINEELHPLNRYQKKNLTLHSNLISQEIELLFGKNISIANISNYSNIYPDTDNLIQYKTGEKYNKLLKKLIKPEKEEEYINPEIIEDNRKKALRRRYIYDKIKDTLKKCMLKFKRLKITKDFFWEILYNEKELTYVEGLYIFNAIKDGDITTIEK